MAITHRTVEANGLRMHVDEAGAGPLVLLLHGFPELGYSYRHQLEALAAAGYHAVAPDQRGYGGTEVPTDPAAYTQLHLVGDVVGLVRALGAEEVVVVGHDWGSPVASNLALFRSDLVRGVVLLSVPYTPRGSVDVLTALQRALGPDNYQAYFQTDAAQRELEADPRATMRAVLVGLSASSPGAPAPGGGFLPDPDLLPDELPAWLTEADLGHYADRFARTGFLGALNWYRNARANWELLAPWHHAPLLAPTRFLGGEQDPVLARPGMRDVLERLHGIVPRLTGVELLDDCGHWIQQERPEAVNGRLLDFLAGLPPPYGDGRDGRRP